MDLTTCKRWCTDTDTTFTFITTGWNDWSDLQTDCWLCLIGLLQARLEIGNWEGFRKKIILWNARTLDIGVFVAIANDLFIILQGKGLQAVINGNEAEIEETGLEVEGKGNGGNSALFNLKDSHFIQFTKLIIMVYFYWIKYCLSQFQIFFFN